MPSREPAGLPHIHPLFLLGLLPLVLDACGGGGGFDLPATTGTLEVTTTTTGDEMDPDGYTVQVDGEAPQAIAIAGRIQRTEFKPGPHTLRLDGVAPNCSVVGDNPRTVAILAGQTLVSDFAVTCSATSGGITITTATGGAALDPDGYAVVLDGVEQGPIPTNGQVALTGLALGNHVVGLSGLAGNCLLEGENLRVVTVTPAGSAPVDYAVTCAAPPPDAGTLRLITTTTGNAPPPPGYTFALDGAPGQPIAANATADIINLAPGPHQVLLSSLPDNCRVGDNPRSVNVAAGGTTEARFTVACILAVGAIRVSVSSSGRPADPNGYLAQLDNTAPGVRVVAGGSVRFTDVPVGSHTITLTDVAPNCSVNGGPSQAAAVTTGGRTEVGFTVSCSQTGGSIAVTTQTSGTSPDPDGYEVAVDGGPSRSIDSDGGSTTFDGLTPGEHTVRISGVAANCSVGGGEEHTVTVAAGGTAQEPFTITCTSTTTTGSIHVTTSTGGADPDVDGYEIAVDGGPSRSIDSDGGSTTFDGLTPGEHTVRISGVAANCSVGGGEEHTVTVAAGNTAQEPFTITCTTSSGSIDVAVSVLGEEQDDEYTVTLDDSWPGKGVRTSERASFTDVSPGDHKVDLNEVASNCDVTDGSSRMLSLSNGEALQVNFAVTCAATGPGE